MFKFIHTKQVFDIVEPRATLGIEITDPVIAARCELGNIDGQHGAIDTPREWEGKAAIEIAVEYPHQCISNYTAWASMCGGCDQPKNSPYCECAAAAGRYSDRHPIALATSRPDVDSIGAMAILVLHSLGLENVINLELVATIAKADSFRPGGEWERRPLPMLDNPWPSGANSVDSTQGIAHFGMICSPRRGDLSDPKRLGHRIWDQDAGLAFRVFVMACALIGIESWALPDEHGPFGEDAKKCSNIAAACGIGASWVDALDTLNQSKQDILESRRALVRASFRPGAIEEHIGFVVVRVAHAGALGLGYCVAPVVIAFDQSVSGKVTIAAYDLQYLDVDGLKRRLNELESGWGGQRTIVGSPQNGGTKLSSETIVAVVSEFVHR